MSTPLFTTPIKRDGSDQPPVERRALHAGPLSLVLEGADLRDIRLGDRAALDRVYVAVRDPNWGTVPAVYANMRLDSDDDHFTVAFDAVHREGVIDFAWHGTIRGDAGGTITYTMDGVARADFMKNRIGFCVLHPMTCAGVPCTVEGVDGSVREAAFPREIAPDQPFKEFRAITHEVTPDVRVEVRLDGDIFEMEDQRNWTDASFKTYSTPLRLPYPVEVRAGTTITQSCTLSLHGATLVRNQGPLFEAAPPGTAALQSNLLEKTLGHATPSDAPITVRLDSAMARPLPRLGQAAHGAPLTDGALERLRALRPAHLRVDLDPATDVAGLLGEATRQARALGAALEIALFLSDAAEGELQSVASALSQVQPPVARWLVLQKDGTMTRAESVRAAQEILGAYTPQAVFGGGVNAYFAELNRDRPPRDALDLVCYSINPQAHAFDNASLVETLPAQAATLASARAFCGATALAVSPITLRPRFNPVATGPVPAPVPGMLPPQVDPRQMSLFGAVWTLGSVKYLAEGGAASATYYETTGWRGVMETATGPALPERFHAQPGMLFPLYHVLADVGEFADGVALGCVSSDPRRADGLALRDGQRARLLLGNMTAIPLRVRVEGISARAVRIRYLDEESFERATTAGDDFRREPGKTAAIEAGVLELTLRPYAVARIDSDSDR